MAPRVSAPALTATKPQGFILRYLPCLRSMIVKAVLKARIMPPREEVTTSPAKLGIEFKDVDIMSTDGVRLSAWEIVVPGSTKLIIVNHPLMCTRAGVTKGLDMVSVDYMPMYKILVDAGYSVITYDQRAQGLSDGGIGKTRIGPKDVPCGVGATEWQDFVGVLRYVDNHPTLAKASIGVYGQCMGANAVMLAAVKAPSDFAKVRCMVAMQPTLSLKMMSRMTKIKVGADIAMEVDDISDKEYGIRAVDSATNVKSVTVPIMFVQMRGDVYTEDEWGSDSQTLFESCPSSEKEMLWLGPKEAKGFGSCKRFESYEYFNTHPEDLLQFYAKHM